MKMKAGNGFMERRLEREEVEEECGMTTKPKKYKSAFAAYVQSQPGFYNDGRVDSGHFMDCIATKPKHALQSRLP